MRFRFIEDRRANYPVSILCEVLGVSLAAWMTSGKRPRGGAVQSHAAEPAGQSPISLSRKTCASLKYMDVLFPKPLVCNIYDILRCTLLKIRERFYTVLVSHILQISEIATQF
jgi:hypothetical protein